MFVSLKEILKNELFKKGEVLAGSGGLDRNAKRISVFDCPCREDLIKREILREGDLFITCLEQFKHDEENISRFIDTLIYTGSAGLIVVSEDMIHILNPGVLKRCNEGNLPVVLLKEEIPYAAIIDTVNKYIAIDNMHALNMLKLEKIMYGNISFEEKMETLYSINPNVKQYVRVISVDGEFNSDIAQLELHMYYLDKKSDIYVRSGQNMIFILSDDSQDALRRHSDAAAVRFSEFLDNPVAGYSRIAARKEIEHTLEEARRALETAKAMQISRQTYDPLSVLQLLLLVRDSREAGDFYQKYVDMIRSHVSAENLQETLRTMEVYVANSGNFQETARMLNQHENTIRYRVNKVKQALDMENDNIKFHETIAIAVKLRTLLHESI